VAEGIGVLARAGSRAVSLARGGVGARVGRLGPRPTQPLEIYEFESCPFCRKVREAFCVLDLPVLVKPCPKRGRRFRDELRARGGKLLFPYLVDPDVGVEMYESRDIVGHLFARYGAGAPPPALAHDGLHTAGSVLAGLLRPGGGTFARPSRAPERPLELYGFEASPDCRLVREVLCALEIPYRLTNVARGSPRRGALAARAGRFEVPWLHDPNTGAELFGASACVDHLEATYAAPGPRGVADAA